MGKRRGRALFEVIHPTSVPPSSIPVRHERPASFADRPHSTSSAAPASAAAIDSVGPAPGSRLIRLPVGYIIVALILALVALVAAYSVGFSLGKQTERAAIEAAGNRPVVSEPDPSATGHAPTGSNPQNPPSKELDRRADISGGPTGGNEKLAGPPAPAVPPRDRDTRKMGLNYVIIEQFSPEEANLVADFLASNGIDVMVLPTNNVALRQVVSRQGFEGFYSDHDAQILVDRLKRLGTEWQGRHNGSKDFSQLYGSQFSG